MQRRLRQAPVQTEGNHRISRCHNVSETSCNELNDENRQYSCECAVNQWVTVYTVAICPRMNLGKRPLQRGARAIANWRKPIGPSQEVRSHEVWPLISSRTVRNKPIVDRVEVVPEMRAPRARLPNLKSRQRTHEKHVPARRFFFGWAVGNG